MELINLGKSILGKSVCGRKQHGGSNSKCNSEEGELGVSLVYVCRLRADAICAFSVVAAALSGPRFRIARVSNRQRLHLDHSSICKAPPKPRESAAKSWESTADSRRKGVIF